MYFSFDSYILGCKKYGDYFCNAFSVLLTVTCVTGLLEASRHTSGPSDAHHSFSSVVPNLALCTGLLGNSGCGARVCSWTVHVHIRV